MKKYLPFFVALVAVGALAFYGGTKFPQNNTFPENFQNLTSEQRQQRFQQMGGAQNLMQRGGTMGNLISGEILKSDATSITLKLRDGGSRIIFFSDTVQITQSTKATAEDLTVGKTVRTTGTANPDGSLTAQTIQIEALKEPLLN